MIEAFAMAWINQEGVVTDLGIYSEGPEEITIVDHGGSNLAILWVGRGSTYREARTAALVRLRKLWPQLVARFLPD